jgi:hypothetical protein
MEFTFEFTMSENRLRMLMLLTPAKHCFVS